MFTAQNQIDVMEELAKGFSFVVKHDTDFYH
jgi:hypothetical protein